MWEATCSSHLQAPLRAFQSTPPVWEATEQSTRSKPAVIFQSTPPVWEATRALNKINACAQISIHASRVGGDTYAAAILKVARTISIHASRVGGDLCVCTNDRNIRISIHASRVGGDAPLHYVRGAESYFNPRLPCGRRHDFKIGSHSYRNFNPRLPCGRRPQKSMKNGQILWNFC